MNCQHCDEAILADDSHHPNMQMHAECVARLLIGGLNHQLGLCTCFGGDLPNDPPELSTREAARIAQVFYRLRMVFE